MRQDDRLTKLVQDANPSIRIIQDNKDRPFDDYPLIVNRQQNTAFLIILATVESTTTEDAFRNAFY